MMRVSVWLTAALWVCGCQSGEDPPRGAHGEYHPPQVTPTPKVPREPLEAPRPEPYRELPELELAGDEEEAKRELSVELNQAIGTPMDCIADFKAAQPTTLRISVSATVRPTGMVILPSIYGSGISNAARKCIETRVETVVLPELDEPSSERVTTVIELEYSPEVIVESDPGTPEPQLRNVREPLPKRPEVQPSGRPIQQPTSKWISSGFDGGRPIQGPTSKKIKGPKPRPIDGYEVDENAKEWR
jgi:hypothetical protein